MFGVMVKKMFWYGGEREEMGRLYRPTRKQGNKIIRMHPH